MHKQTYISKIINVIMLSALIYLSILLITYITNENDIIEKNKKEKLKLNKITENNIFKFLFEKKEKEVCKIPIKKSFNTNLLLNGTFAIILAGFINWTNILFTGTI